MFIFTVFLFTQLLIDFKPTVFATDYVGEVISSSYFFNYLMSLSKEHTIDVTSVLSVVSQGCHNIKLCTYVCSAGGSHLKFQHSTRILSSWLCSNESTFFWGS